MEPITTMAMDIRTLWCCFIVFTTMATGEAAVVKVCIGQFLNTLDLEICPYGRSVRITAAYFGQSSPLARTALDQCPSDPGDCRGDIMAEYPDYFDFVKRQCERKILCDIFIVEGEPITCGTSAINPDYLYFEYECASVSNQLLYDVSCVGDAIDTPQCQVDFGIKIVQAMFADTGTGGCEVHDTIDYQCLANITQIQPRFFQDLLDSCEGLTECSGTVTAEAYSVGDCWNATDVTSNNVVLGYECVPVVKSARACPFQPFDHLSCAPGYVIDVLAAYYVDQLGDYTLAECENLAAVNVCLTDISQRNRNYYRQIVDKCQDKQACEESLVADRGFPGQCFRNERPDYVRIYYQCMVGVLPSTTEGSTVPTTSAASTTRAASTTASTTAEPSSTPEATTASTTAEPSSTPEVTTASTTAESSSTAATNAESRSTTVGPSSTTAATSTPQSSSESTTAGTTGAPVSTSTGASTVGDTTVSADTTLPPQSTTAAPEDTTVKPSTPEATDSTNAPEGTTTATNTTEAPATTTAAPSPLSQTQLYIIVGVAVGLVPLVGIILAIVYCCKKSIVAAPKTTPPAVQQYDPYFLPKNTSTVPSNFRW